jgi:hypothetical protein
MKSWIAVLVCLAAVFYILVPAVSAQDEFIPGTDTKIRWADYDKEYKKNAKRKKPVMMYFFSPAHEEFCRGFEQDVFPKVRPKTGKLLCFKINSEMNSRIAAEYGLKKGDAAVLLIDFQGTLIKKYTDVPEQKEFGKDIDKAAKTNTARTKLLKKIKKALKIADNLLKKKRYKEAYEYWEWIIKQKGQVVCEDIERIEAELKRLKEESKSAVEAAISAAESVINQYRNIGGFGGGRGSSSYEQHLMRAERDVSQAGQKVFQAERKYPFAEVAQKLAGVKRQLSEILRSIAEERRRIAEEKKKKQK